MDNAWDFAVRRFRHPLDIARLTARAGPYIEADMIFLWPHTVADTVVSYARFVKTPHTLFPFAYFSVLFEAMESRF